MFKNFDFIIRILVNFFFEEVEEENQNVEEANQNFDYFNDFK